MKTTIIMAVLMLTGLAIISEGCISRAERNRLKREQQEQVIRERAARIALEKDARLKAEREQQEKGRQAEEQKRQEDERLKAEEAKKQRELQLLADEEAKKRQELQMIIDLDAGCYDQLRSFTPRNGEENTLRNRVMELNDLRDHLRKKIVDVDTARQELKGNVAQWQDRVKKQSIERGYRSFAEVSRDSGLMNWLALIRTNKERIIGLDGFKTRLSLGREDVILAYRRACDQFNYLSAVGPQAAGDLLEAVNKVIADNNNLMNRQEKIKKEETGELKRIWQEIMRN